MVCRAATFSLQICRSAFFAMVASWRVTWPVHHQLLLIWMVAIGSVPHRPKRSLFEMVLGKNMYRIRRRRSWCENSWFSPVLWSKLKIVTIQSIKSWILDTIDDWYINNLAKNQVSAVFHSRVICRSVSPKFIELCMETPCLCPSEGHKHSGRKIT